MNRPDANVVSFSEATRYAAARPAYPEAVYALLTEYGALRGSIRALDIGAGPGVASQRLLAAGVAHLLAIEPDQGFRPALEALAAEHAPRFRFLCSQFESAAFAPERFDLAVAATAWHWLDPATRVTRAAEALGEAGHLALWWNVFADPLRADPFHEATLPVLERLSPPSDAGDGIPFPLAVDERCRELTRGGEFALIAHDITRWTLVLTAEEVGALYSTFSVTLRLPPDERAEVLDSLMAIAEREFGGRVERNMTTPVYVARRVYR